MGYKVYDYTCNKCDERSELWIKNDETAICPRCGSDDMKRCPVKTRFNMDKSPYEEFGL
tara:strand:- start:354 stop:530 length:177 start_codon:yes stop_codon:yes gene_type:complete